MNRRDFIRSCAMLAAGAAALPQQIEVFEKLYEANTPLSASGRLLSITDILIAGQATASEVLSFHFQCGPAHIQLGLNSFGGIIRWTPTAFQVLTAGDPSDVCWEFNREPSIIGQICYLDQDLRQHMVQLDSGQIRGSLKEDKYERI